jgi:hypothetical protein
MSFTSTTFTSESIKAMSLQELSLIRAVLLKNAQSLAKKSPPMDFQQGKGQSLRVVDEEYQDVLRLNDIGVQLLEAGSYRQAALTFREAVNLLKRNIAVVSTPAGEYEKRIQLACQRLESAMPCTVAQKLIRVEPLYSTSNDSIEEDIQGFLRGMGGITMHPIKIPLIEVGRPMDAEFDSAVLLLNMGIAFYCLALTTHNTTMATKKQAKAISLFQAAYAVLSRIQQTPRILRTTVVALYSLAQVSDKKDNGVETTKILQQMLYFAKVIQDMESS